MAWSVIREQHKEEITRIIKDQFSVRLGSSAIFQHYQTMLAEVMSGLSSEEIQNAELTATEWNSQGATTEVKAQ